VLFDDCSLLWAALEERCRAGTTNSKSTDIAAGHKLSAERLRDPHDDIIAYFSLQDISSNALKTSQAMLSRHLKSLSAKADLAWAKLYTSLLPILAADGHH
jgi:hypothetical protein